MTAPVQMGLFDRPAAPTPTPTGTPPLRDYQEACLAAIRAYRDRGGKRALVALPTGTGKTVVFSRLPEMVAPARMLVVAHREELLDQAQEKIQAANPALTVEIEQADRRASPLANVVVASIQTLSAASRADWLDSRGFGLVVIDEAHHSTSATYLGLLARLWLQPDPSTLRMGLEGLEPAAQRKVVIERRRAFRVAADAPLLVGFTATPKRTDGVGLQWVFDEQVYGRSMLDMMRAGWLCPVRGVRVSTTDTLKGITVRSGDFAPGELEERLDNGVRNGLILQSYQEHAAGRQAIVFTVGVAHTHAVARVFNRAGIPAAAVVGSTPPEERREAIAAYRNNAIRVLVNCMVLTEGFDAPETSAIIMARPTKSSLIYTQCVGRGTRLAPGNPDKDLLVIDLVDAGRDGVQDLAELAGVPPEMLRGGLSVLDAVHAEEGRQARLAVAEAAEEEARQVALTAEDFDPLRGQRSFRDASRNRWLATASGGHMLLLPGDERLEVATDMLGHSHVQANRRKTDEGGGYSRTTEHLHVAETPEAAIAWADAWLRDQRPAAALVADDNAPWRRSPASQKQMALIERLRAKGRIRPEDIPPHPTKGQASALIDLALNKGRLAPA